MRVVVRFLAETSDLLRSVVDRIQKNSVESNTVTTVVDRFKIVFETLDHSDTINVVIPTIVFVETLGVSPFFRFDYDRFGYGRFGDVGGQSDVVGVVIT